jgi:hypothetical protein
MIFRTALQLLRWRLLEQARVLRPPCEVCDRQHVTSNGSRPSETHAEATRLLIVEAGR